MFEKKLTEYKKEAAYKEVMSSAELSLARWMKSNLEDVSVLNEVKWKLDDAVFFNTDKNRALLLLPIQDTIKDASLDYVYILYAANENDKWNIYFAGLPNLVYRRADIDNRPLSLNQLSKLGRDEILKSYMDAKGTINDVYVNSFYSADLKAGHIEFLKNKQR